MLHLESFIVSLFALIIAPQLLFAGTAQAATYGAKDVEYVTTSRNLDVINYVICLNDEVGNSARNLSITDALNEAEQKCRNYAHLMPRLASEPDKAMIRQMILECGFRSGDASPDAGCDQPQVPDKPEILIVPPPGNFPPATFPIDAASWGGKVRAGPGTNFRHQDSLQEGNKVTLLENTGVMFNGYPWFRIRYQRRYTGYQWGGILCGIDAPIEGVFERCTKNSSPTPLPPVTRQIVPSDHRRVPSSGADTPVTEFSMYNDSNKDFRIAWINDRVEETTATGGDASAQNPWISPGQSWRVENGAKTWQSHWFALYSNAGFLCSFSPRQATHIRISELTACGF